MLVWFFSGNSVHADINVLSTLICFACKGFCVELTRSAFVSVWMRPHGSVTSAVDG